MSQTVPGVCCPLLKRGQALENVRQTGPSQECPRSQGKEEAQRGPVSTTCQRGGWWHTVPCAVYPSVILDCPSKGSFRSLRRLPSVKHDGGPGDGAAVTVPDNMCRERA